VHTRLIGLGNTILSDDGVGVYLARAVKQRLGAASTVDVVESEVGGFDLMELMRDWERVLLVDAVQLAGLAPGELVRLELDGPRGSLRLASIHDVDLPTGLELGRRLGYAMPDEVELYGVQGVDLFTVGEELTPALAAALPRLTEELLAALARQA